LTNSGTSPATATYSITSTASGCTGNPLTVVVTVNPIPVATATPVTQTICSGGTTSIALTSTVSGTVFNWTVLQTGVSGGTNASSPTSIAQALATLSPSTPGTAVYTITPTANGCAGAPITVTITVNPNPIITATPSSQTLCSGSAASIALTSNVPGSTFTWTVVQTGGVTGGASGTGTSITDVLTTTTAGTAVYTIVPTANACIGISLQVTITVNPMDNAAFSYSSTSFCQTGANPTPTVTGLPGGTFSAAPAGLSINPSTGTVTLSTSTIGTYTVTYTTAGICPNTSSVTLTVTASPLAGFSYTGSPYCQYASNPSPTFVPGGFAGTFTAIPAGLVFANANTGVINLLTSTPGTYTVKNYIAGGGGCASDSATSSVTISPTPVATATPSSHAICSGSTTAITLTSTLPGTTYAWTVVQTNVTGGSSGVGSPIAQTLSSTTIGTAVYSIVPTVGLCPGAPIMDTVIVNPIPVVTATPPTQAFCSGGTTSMALTSSVTGSNFTWTASEAGVTGATFGSGTTIAQTLTNTGSIAGTAIYSVTATANGCPGAALNVTVTVNPRDNASFVYSSATYCQSGGTETPVITGLPGGIFTSTPVGLTLNPSTGTIILSSSALGAYTLSYITNGTCPDTSSITMTIANSAPLATFSYTGSPFCQNGIDPSPVFVAGASAGIFSATPLGLAFVNVNTGKINLSASTAGTYTVTNTIPASGNCAGTSATTVVVITASDNASFTYSSATYCQSGPAQTPIITGVPGGTFSSAPAGLSLNPTTGTITLSTSAIGSYTLTYHTTGPCPNTSSIVMTIDSLTPSANFTYLVSPFCHNGNNPSPVFASGASAGTFSVTPGGLVFVNANTGQIDLTASASGTYTVTNTIPASGTCLSASATATVTISPADNASFVYSSATYCQTGPNETPTITGLPGGVFAATPPGLSINPSTGTINISVSTLGSYTLSYTTNGPCPNTSSITMSITASTNFAGFSYPNPTYCHNGTNPLPVFNPGATAGVFTTNPLGLAFVNINTGQIDLANSTPGTYTISNTVPASGGCAPVVATTTVTITPADNASFVYTSATYCTSGTPQTPVITGLPGGTFSSSPAGLSINPATGTITLSTSALGVYALTYTTNGSCPSASTITMNIVNSTPFAAFSYPASPFCQNIANPSPVFGPGASAGVFTSSPGGLVFVQVNTGQIDLGASIPGTYTVTNTIPASGTCGAVTAISTVVITPADNASFVYSSATYCQTGPNPTPSITGLPGGSFLSIPPGLSVNASTGTINLATSLVGAYTLSYTTNGPCPKTSSIIMTINTSTSSATFSYPGSPFCQNGTNPYPTFASGASAGIFTSSPAGMVFIHVNTGQINLSASAPGTYTVTNTIPASGGCAAVVATSTVTINAPDNAQFTYTSATYCTSGSPQSPLSTATPGGTFFAIPPGLSLNPVTGTITLSTSTLGVYTLSYRTNGTCPDTTSITMTITNTTPFANFSYAGSPFCQFGTNPFPNFGPGASAGTFTSSPAGLVFINVNTGQINLSLSAPGTYTVTNTIPVSGTCGAVSATSTVVIGGAPIAVATVTSQDVCTGGNTTINVTSTTSGTTYAWTVIPTSITGASAGVGASIAQGLTYTGTVPGTGTAVYTITPTANGCPGLPIIVTVTVHSLPVADTAAVNITPAKCGSTTGGIAGVVMSSGTPPFTYQWKDSLGNSVGSAAALSNAGKGQYTVTVTDSFGCSVTAGPFTIHATPPVVAAFTANPLTGQTPLTVTFTNNSSTEATKYLWEFGTGDTSNAVNPTYIYHPLGLFKVCLVAGNGFGCNDTTCDSITVFINSVFIVPNIFTPNGDNINDIFTLKAIGLKMVDAQIFNRWGEKEYEWHTTNGGWDGFTASGLAAPSGTYYYVINATGIDGKVYFQKGAFTLVRDK
jgi:gliding motility-associated-like protein